MLFAQTNSSHRSRLSWFGSRPHLVPVTWIRSILTFLNQMNYQKMSKSNWEWIKRMSLILFAITRRRRTENQRIFIPLTLSLTLKSAPNLINYSLPCFPLSNDCVWNHQRLTCLFLQLFTILNIVPNIKRIVHQKDQSSHFLLSYFHVLILLLTFNCDQNYFIISYYIYLHLLCSSTFGYMLVSETWFEVWFSRSDEK